MRQIVQESIAPAPASPPPAPAPGTSASGADPSPEVPNGSPPVPVEGQAPASDVTDACAYDPAQAQAALDAGEPPTRQG
jgi:hypothetical protein